MKKALIIFAWVSIFGSIGDGLIAFYGGYLVIFDAAVSLSISVENLIRDHIGFLYWVKQVAFYVMPSNIVSWLFALPALIYFPIRVFTSILIGLWILKIAANMPDRRVTEMRAGDLFYVPAEPHDSWVVGDQPYVSLHFLGAGEYAK